jgi:hypothetical protein
MRSEVGTFWWGYSSWIFVLVIDITTVVRLTPIYINSEAVIPTRAGIQLRNPRFRVKLGMTNNGKGFLT